MSDLAADAFSTLVKKLGRLGKKQPWQRTRHSWVEPLKDPGWSKVSEIILSALDEMRADGSAQPLAALQDVAFYAALKPGAQPHVHTACLWLTDTRLRVERFRSNPEDRELRRCLEQRGLLKPKPADKKEDDPEPARAKEPERKKPEPAVEEEEVDDSQLSLLGEE